MRIRGLDHFVLTVADLELTVAFYELLGMRKESFGDGRIALRFGSQKINLHRTGEEFAPHARHPVPGSADVCLLVDDHIEAVARDLRNAGLTIELGPVDRTGAEGPLRSIYVRDPDGNLVELSQPAPAAP